MYKTLSIIVAIILSSSIQAKELKYIAALIPDSLKENAYAVIRDQRMTVNIDNINHSKTTLHKAITVLNSKGKKKAWESFSYDKNKNIIEISARMYDAMGNEVDKCTRKKWNDVSYDPYGTIYSDSRSLQLTPTRKTYPYTIEYKVVYERNNTYMVDGWHPVWEDNLSIEKSKFTLSYSPDVKVKIKEYNFNKNISKTDNQNSVDWEIQNMQAIESEPYGPSRINILPYISIDTYEFSYENHIGKSNTWKEFGLFFGELNKGRDILPEERKPEVDKIISTCKTDDEKVKALYDYMQSHTRYINISIGIGGIQTFPAESVSNNGYGDCKALSNYMHSLLKYAGIKSYFTLVQAGAFKYDFDVDYVGHQFNHAILCVPMQQDTIWLECTSQTMPCGFLGDFTDNRQVLLITEEGGVLTKTPKYDKKQNKVSRTAEVKVSETGDCKASLTSIYTGLKYDDKHWLTVKDKEEQLKMLYADFNIPNFKIDNFELNTIKTSKPELDEEINLTLPSYASKSGSRLFLPINLASKWSYVPKKVKNRTFDIYRKYENWSSDSITYIIPDNYTIEVVPKTISIENKYGKYTSSSEVIDNKLIYHRYMEVNSGVFPAEEYDAYIEFFKNIKKNDNAMAILKLKE